MTHKIIGADDTTGELPAVVEQRISDTIDDKIEVEEAARVAADSLLIPLTQKGASNGVATLNANGLQPLSQQAYPIVVASSEGAIPGVWDAETNTPTLVDSTGKPGTYFVVYPAGTQDLGSGPIDFAEFSIVYHNGNSWVNETPPFASCLSAGGLVLGNGTSKEDEWWTADTPLRNVINALTTYLAPVDSPVLSGNPTLSGSPSSADNSTAIATTEFVKQVSSPELTILSTTLVSTTATADSYLPVNSSSGPITITLPTAPPFGTVVAVAPVTGANTVTVVRGGSDVIAPGGATSRVIGTGNDVGVMSWQYRNDNAWWPLQPVQAIKANLASPAFTGNPTAPTPTTNDNDTSLATTAFSLPRPSVTSVQTSNYTAAAGEYVRMDTTSGGLTLTLPTAPADKTVVWVQRSGGGNALSIARGGSDVISPGAVTTRTISTGQSSAADTVAYIYNTASATWFPLGLVPADNIQRYQINAKGDLLAGLSDDSVTRLAVGTDGQFLVAASGQATGLQWTNTILSALRVDSTAATMLNLANTSAPANQRRWLANIQTASGNLTFEEYNDAFAFIKNKLVLYRNSNRTDIDGISHITGTGSPEGVVTAGIGSRYVDTAATNGAVEWVKYSGSGNTGWRVVYGDTGIRQPATTSPNMTGNFSIRRIGDVVEFKQLTLAPGASGTNSGETVYTLPVGFRPTTGTAQGLWGTSTNEMDQMWSIQSNGVVTFFGTNMTAGQTIYITTIQWLTSDTWPTTLP